MAAVNIPDLVLDNILARLSAKYLIRCRCVSKHWNRLITDPQFMRSRRMMFLTLEDHYHTISDSSKTRPRYTVDGFQYPMEDIKDGHPDWVDVVGTFNGMVLLQYHLGDDLDNRPSRYNCSWVLYNPFTRASEKIPKPPSVHCNRERERLTYACGFGHGHGASPDDLKIIIFRHNQDHFTVCHVFSLKDGTWSCGFKWLGDVDQNKFLNHVGTFHNGFLYWISRFKNLLVAVDVENMVYMKEQLPFQRSNHFRTFLGTADGCLCLLNGSEKNETDFDLWVMNKGKGNIDKWSKRCSFTLSLDHSPYREFHRPLCVLDDRRILMHASEGFFSEDRGLLYIYDISDNSYTIINVSLDGEEIYMPVHGLHYVESLVSPSAVCYGNCRPGQILLSKTADFGTAVIEDVSNCIISKLVI